MFFLLNVCFKPLFKYFFNKKNAFYRFPIHGGQHFVHQCNKIFDERLELDRSLSTNRRLLSNMATLVNAILFAAKAFSIPAMVTAIAYQTNNSKCINGLRAVYILSSGSL